MPEGIIAIDWATPRPAWTVRAFAHSKRVTFETIVTIVDGERPYTDRYQVVVE